MKSWLVKEQTLFSHHITAGNLPHAILISGVKGSGKENLANWLIQVIQCSHVIQGNILQPCHQCKHCNLLLKNNYPDHSTVIPDKNLLGIDSVRKVSAFFEKTAQIGTIKSVLIPEAEKMTISAANALLKTLEEPTNNSFIVLLTEERDTLLPTLISRCRLFEIRPPSGDVLAQHINVNYKNESAFINLSHFPELSSEEIADEYSVFEQACLNFLTQQGGKSQVIKMVVGSSHGLRWLEKVITNAMRNTNGWGSHINITQNSSALLNNDTLWHIYNKIVSTISQSKTLSQVNHQFMIEKLIIDIDNIVTHGKLQE
jgi:DNA polymerase-3 subunit delta'